MPTVVFLDLDGTLWEQGVVPESAQVAIRAAQANGHKFLTNTGRARSEVSDLAYVGLDGYCFAADAEVILDGHHVVDTRMDATLAKAVAAVFDSFGLNYNYEGGDASWMTVNDKAAHHAMVSAFSGKPDPIMSVPPASEMTDADDASIHKMFYHGASIDYAPVAAQMPEGDAVQPL